MSEAYLKIADGLKLMAAGYEALAAGTNTEVPAPKAKKPEKKETEAEAPKEASVPKVTLEDVRAVLADKSRDGKTQQVKALLNQFGADKLSSVPADRLAELKEKAEVL